MTNTETRRKIENWGSFDIYQVTEADQTSRYDIVERVKPEVVYHQVPTYDAARDKARLMHYQHDIYDDGAPVPMPTS